jgi:hypothetical protein
LQEPGPQQQQQQQQVLTQVNSRQSCCSLAVGMLQQLPLQLAAVLMQPVLLLVMGW